METPAPFSLDAALQRWRAHINQVPGISRDRLEELESHLRDSLDRLTAVGLADDEAWIIAQKRLGRSEVLATEFANMDNLTADAQPECGDAARNASIIAIGTGFALTGILSYVGERCAIDAADGDNFLNTVKVAWSLDLLAALAGGYVTALIAKRFPVRHAFRAALILTPLSISLSLLGANPFLSGDLWARLWPGLVMGATMCIGAALVRCQRSNTSRTYFRKITRFIQDRWSLSGSTARIQP